MSLASIFLILGFCCFAVGVVRSIVTDHWLPLLLGFCLEVVLLVALTVTSSIVSQKIAVDTPDSDQINVVKTSRPKIYYGAIATKRDVAEDDGLTDDHQDVVTYRDHSGYVRKLRMDSTEEHGFSFSDLTTTSQSFAVRQSSTVKHPTIELIPYRASTKWNFWTSFEPRKWYRQKSKIIYRVILLTPLNYPGGGKIDF